MTLVVREEANGETVHVLRNTQLDAFSEAVGALDAKFLETLVDCLTSNECGKLVDIERICSTHLHHQ